MNKRITSLLLAVVMICSMLATAVPVFAAPGDSGVSASVTEASPGDTFTVTLTVPGTEKQISDIGVKVHFDSTVFEVTEYTIPSIAGMAKMQSNVAEANSNAFFSATYDSDSSDADITFTGLQLTATFKVKEGAAAGTYAFELDSTCKVGSLTDMGLPDILVKYEDFTSKSVSVTVTAPHSHVYDQEVATAEHLKTAATCTAAAVYYKSCTCGENGEETFTSGSALGHEYTQKFEDAAHLKTAASKCTEHNIYWYDCSRCDSNAKNDPEAADKYFTSTTTGSHSFTEKIEDAAHYMAGTGTDCQSVKQYYYDCAYCDQIGTATWDSTTYGAHTEGTEWKFDENKHWHICTVEGCGVVIESSKEAHTPDRAEATVNDPIKCSVCGYEIEAQLVAVTNIAATITAPVLGATPDYTPTYVSTPSGGVQFGEVTWYKIKKEDYTGTYEDNWTEMASDETFTTEYYYSADMFFRPEDGYGISEDVTGTVNGKAHVDTYGSVYGEDPNGGDYAYLCIEFGPLHDADTEHFESDADNHWNNCANCDEKQNIAPHAFEWIIDKEATATEKGSKHEECTVCGYAKASVDIPATGTEKTENPDTGDANNMLLWGALLLAGGLGVTGTAAYSKKRREDAE